MHHFDGSFGLLFEKGRRLIVWSNVKLLERSFQGGAVTGEVGAGGVVEEQQLLLHHFHAVLVEEAQFHLKKCARLYIQPTQKNINSRECAKIERKERAMRIGSKRIKIYSLEYRRAVVRTSTYKSDSCAPPRRADLGSRSD